MVTLQDFIQTLKSQIFYKQCHVKRSAHRIVALQDFVPELEITRTATQTSRSCSRIKRLICHSRWGQTTPQMGHEMSRFLVNF